MRLGLRPVQAHVGANIAAAVRHVLAALPGALPAATDCEWPPGAGDVVVHNKTARRIEIDGKSLAPGASMPLDWADASRPGVVRISKTAQVALREGALLCGGSVRVKRRSGVLLRQAHVALVPSHAVLRSEMVSTDIEVDGIRVPRMSSATVLLPGGGDAWREERSGSLMVSPVHAWVDGVVIRPVATLHNKLSFALAWSVSGRGATANLLPPGGRVDIDFDPRTAASLHFHRFRCSVPLAPGVHEGCPPLLIHISPELRVDVSSPCYIVNDTPYAMLGVAPGGEEPAMKSPFVRQGAFVIENRNCLVSLGSRPTACGSGSRAAIVCRLAPRHTIVNASEDTELTVSLGAGQEAFTLAPGATMPWMGRSGITRLAVFGVSVPPLLPARVGVYDPVEHESYFVDVDAPLDDGHVAVRRVRSPPLSISNDSGEPVAVVVVVLDDSGGESVDEVPLAIGETVSIHAARAGGVACSSLRRAWPREELAPAHERAPPGRVRVRLAGDTEAAWFDPSMGSAAAPAAACGMVASLRGHASIVRVVGRAPALPGDAASPALPTVLAIKAPALLEIELVGSLKLIIRDLEVQLTALAGQLVTHAHVDGVRVENMCASREFDTLLLAPALSVAVAVAMPFDGHVLLASLSPSGIVDCVRACTRAIAHTDTLHSPFPLLQGSLTGSLRPLGDG